MASYILRGIDPELFARAKAKAGTHPALQAQISELVAGWVSGKPASVQRDSARAAHADTKAELIMLVAILTRFWPAFLTPTEPQDAMFPCVVCLDSPAGRLTYRLSVSDLDAFQHVEQRMADDERTTKADRLARLLHLAVEGWTHRSGSVG